jgi:hypothetical protein
MPKAQYPRLTLQGALLAGPFPVPDRVARKKCTHAQDIWESLCATNHLRHELIVERWRCCPWSSQCPLRNMNDKASREAALEICSFQPYIGMSCYSYVLVPSRPLSMILLMQYNICGSNPVYRQRKSTARKSALSNFFF